MSGLDTTEASGILKEFYLPAVREQLNNKCQLLAQLEKNTEDCEGEEAVMSLHVSRTGSIGARAEGGTLPTYSNQEYTKARFPLRTQTGRIKVSVQAIKALKSNRAAFERAVDSEMKRIKNDLARDVNRQAFGTSDGKIATCGTTTASTTVTLATTTTAVQMRQFYVNQLVDIGTIAEIEAQSAGTNQIGARVTGVDASARTITVAAAVTTDSNDFVFVAGAGGNGDEQKELTGLQTIVDSSGTLFSVNPSTYPAWASYEDVPGTDRTPAESVFEEAMDETEIASGEEIDIWFTTHGVRRGFAAQLTALKRFTNTVDLKGGYKGLEVAAGSKSAAMAVDRDCPAKTAFGLNSAHLIEFVEQDWEWMDEDGAILNRVQNELAYEATIYKIHELGTDMRSAHAKVGALTEA